MSFGFFSANDVKIYNNVDYMSGCTKAIKWKSIQMPFSDKGVTGIVIFVGYKFNKKKNKKKKNNNK